MPQRYCHSRRDRDGLTPGQRFLLAHLDRLGPERCVMVYGRRMVTRRLYQSQRDSRHAPSPPFRRFVHPAELGLLVRRDLIRKVPRTDAFTLTPAGASALFGDLALT